MGAEDLRRGDIVGILHEIQEYPSYLWFCNWGSTAPSEPVRVKERSADAGMPFKVKAVCLPFVLLNSALGQHRMVDVRHCQLVRLSKEYAKEAWKALRRERARTPIPPV